MGYRKPDTSYLKSTLTKLYIEVQSPYNDGFTQWTLKQEMYMIHKQLGDMLKQLPTFAEEEEWLENLAKKEMWEKLNG